MNNGAGISTLLSSWTTPATTIRLQSRGRLSGSRSSHAENRGYGANQKTVIASRWLQCGHYHHDSSDYQYTPQLIRRMAALVQVAYIPACLLRVFLAGARCVRYAFMEIRIKPVSYLAEKCSHRRETLGISHWLPRLFAPIAGASAIGPKLRRFRFR